MASTDTLGCRLHTHHLTYWINRQPYPDPTMHEMLFQQPHMLLSAKL